MFEVSIDFGDFAAQKPRVFDSYSELSSYLERIPNMFGFCANGKAEIKITLLKPQGVTADSRTYLLN